jgi:phosphatidylethanolamine/phosphatidyl-N-methylethanolamine N-methyltransferase
MSKATAHFYDFFSFLYPAVDLFLRPQKKVLLREINRYPAGRVLEIGVGNGSHLPLYQKHTIIGIDISPRMLSLAKHQKTETIQLFEMNGESLQFPALTFDYVVLSHTIAVVANLGQVLQEVHRVLKPQGKVFVLNHFTPDNWLKYIDTSFNLVSGLFHFQSAIYQNSLPTSDKFILEREITLGWFDYFKILIFVKS